MSSVKDLAGDIKANQAEADPAGFAPSENAFRFDESVDPLTGWYRARGTHSKILLTVGLPLALVVLTAGLAFVGLGHIADDLRAGDANALAEAAAETDTLRYVLMTAVGVSLALTLFLFNAIRNDIVRISRQMIECLQRIGNGEHDIVVPAQGRADEYGTLSQEVERIRLASIQFKKLTTERASRVASELEERTRLQVQQEEARIERERALRGIADQFERTVGEVVSGVASASSQLQSTSTMMAASAEQASNRTGEVASAMEEANSGATAAAAASDEFAMSIGEISRQAASSAELARKATVSASEADSTISALAESAEQVGHIVELIQTIAQRTNLLALNASIEAARGGEAGRGFAVVASEVKELAMQTSRATEQVADQIRAMQDTTGASVTALRSIAHEVAQLESTAVSIASAVDQQSVAGQDLARSIDLAARGTEQVSTTIKEVRELSVSTGSAASQVLTSSTALEEQASTLRIQVDDFLKKVRAS
ncbi:MAG: methyl-accepting chemotaxis protein [Erythrobacter sp.]